MTFEEFEQLIIPYGFDRPVMTYSEYAYTVGSGRPVPPAEMCLYTRKIILPESYWDIEYNYNSTLYADWCLKPCSLEWLVIKKDRIKSRVKHNNIYNITILEFKRHMKRLMQLEEKYAQSRFNSNVEDITGILSI